MMVRFLALCLLVVGVVLWRMPQVRTQVVDFVSIHVPSDNAKLNAMLDTMKGIESTQAKPDWLPDEPIDGEHLMAFLYNVLPEKKDLTQVCETRENKACTVWRDAKETKDEIVGLSDGITYEESVRYMIQLYDWEVDSNQTNIAYIEDITGRTPWKSDPEHIMTFENIAWILARIETSSL